MSVRMPGRYDSDVEVPINAYALVQDLEEILVELSMDQRAAILEYLHAPYCGYGCGNADPFCRCEDDS